MATRALTIIGQMLSGDPREFIDQYARLPYDEKLNFMVEEKKRRCQLLADCVEEGKKVSNCLRMLILEDEIERMDSLIQAYTIEAGMRVLGKLRMLNKQLSQIDPNKAMLDFLDEEVIKFDQKPRICLLSP